MDCPIVTKRGEEMLLIARGAFLTETRRGRTGVPRLAWRPVSMA